MGLIMINKSSCKPCQSAQKTGNHYQTELLASCIKTINLWDQPNAILPFNLNKCVLASWFNICFKGHQSETPMHSKPVT